MKSLKPLVLPALALLLACRGAPAQTIYRCGNIYSQSPCTDAVVVQADDPRTEAQRAAAQEALARDKALAKDMETARRRDEALALAQDRAALARAAAAHRKQEHKSVASKRAAKAKPRTAKVQDPDVFTASSGVASSSKKKKATSP